MPGTSLTPRERAVLAAVERRLTNPEIAGEMYVSVRTVESHIASLRRKLGAESRAELMAAASRSRESVVDVPQNPLRGRDAELVDLGQLLDERRWVTVTGPGGVGKTRLALEFARASERTPVVVELEHAAAEDVVARIARAVELEALPADPLAAVGTALAAHPYLLVLDNIDRVGDAVRAALRRIRGVAAGLRVLTTSRTPVGDPAEAILTLAPLASDGADSPAAAVLRDRLTAAGRTLGTDEAAHVAAIAARLDGVPLALELAASVARHLTLADLDERLGTGLSTLDRAAPTGKHRTLETAFEWTWDLLTPDEQDVLRRLAALPRSFDLELASAVTHPGVDGTVLRLLDHSLLVATGDEPRRFRLLAVLREFVHARTEPATIRFVRQRHAEHTTAVASSFIVHARVDDSPAAMAMSAALCPEVNAALRWTLAAQHPDALVLAAALAVGVEQYGSDADSVNALILAARDPLVRSAAGPLELCTLGAALAFVDVGLVDELAAQALQAASTPREALAAHHLAGLAGAYRDAGTAALAHLDEAEGIAVALGDVWEAGAISQMRGIALASPALHDIRAALTALETAMRRFARAGDRTHVNNTRYMMALLAAENGVETERAAEWAAAAATYAESTSNRHELAHAHLAQAMLGVAAQDGRDLISEFRAVGDLRCLHRSLMLHAHSLPPLTRIPVLEEAAGIAAMSDDTRREAAALGALADAHAGCGDRASAFGVLDRLVELVGPDAARAACPPALRAEYRPDAAAATTAPAPLG